MNRLSALTRSPSARSLAPASNAAGRSSAVWISWTWSVTPSEWAASFSAFTCNGAIGSTRYASTSTREIPGTTLLSSSRRLAASSETIIEAPVNVSARSGEAIYKPGPHGIAKREHDDRDGAGCVLRGLSGRGGGGGDDVC